MIHIVKEQTVIDSHKPDIVMDEAGLGLWTDQVRLYFPRGNRKIGGAKRDRTADLLRARQALSQLSYGPSSCFCFSSHAALCASFAWSLDRKSTRLNSSHVAISYAVFC